MKKFLLLLLTSLGVIAQAVYFLTSDARIVLPAFLIALVLNVVPAIYGLSSLYDNLTGNE